MIRVAADTNVYVSAIVFGGTCEAILALARAGIVELFVSPAILRELRVVLGDTFHWTTPQVREALAEVNALAFLVRPSVRLSSILTHDQDHCILETALAAQANFHGVPGPRSPRGLTPATQGRGDAMPVISSFARALC